MSKLLGNKLPIVFGLGCVLVFFQNCGELSGQQDFAVSAPLGENEILVDDMILDRSMLLESEYSEEFKQEQGKAFIEMSEEDIQAAHAIKEKRFATWPGGILRYRFDPSISARDRRYFLSQCEEFSLRANVYCRLKRPQDKEFILIKKMSMLNGCGRAHIGMANSRGKGQVFEIYSSCWYNGYTIKHELMHALGFMHEHQRFDRDRHIRILRRHLSEGADKAYQLLKRTNVQTFTLEYDFESITHYSSWHGGTRVNGRSRPAFVKVSDKSTVSLNRELSRLDHRGLIRVYGRKNP